MLFDRSAAIQQLISIALREINKKEAVQAYREGRMTLRQCADMLGVDYFEFNEILDEQGTPIVHEPGWEAKTISGQIKHPFRGNSLSLSSNLTYEHKLAREFVERKGKWHLGR
ncbi:MAG: UPF0175 family protein [Clostridia bacterium]|nr:UPF0175 family protein [Clostridia bacterium]